MVTHFFLRLSNRMMLASTHWRLPWGLTWKRRWEDQGKVTVLSPWPLIFLPSSGRIRTFSHTHSVVQIFSKQVLGGSPDQRMMQIQIFLNSSSGYAWTLTHLQKCEWEDPVNTQLFELIWLPLFATILGTLGQILLKISLIEFTSI